MFHYPAATQHIAKNTKEKDRRDFSIDGDLRPFASSSLLIMIPRRFSRRRSPFIPSPPNIPDIVWTAAADHLSSLSTFLSRSLFLVRLLRNSLSTKKAKNGEEREEGTGGGGDGKRRTCAREALSFSSARSFPAAFLPPVPCCYLLPFVRKASGAMKICCSLFETYGRLDVSLLDILREI